MHVSDAYVHEFRGRNSVKGGGGGGECKMMNTQLSSNSSRTYHIQVTLCPHFARG